MAVSTGLKRFLRRLTAATLDYAKQHAWDSKDVQVYYRFVSDWDRLHVIIVIPDFEGLSEFQVWSSILTHLSAEFADEPDVMNHVNLLVRTTQQVEGGGIYSIGPEYREFRISRKA